MSQLAIQFSRSGSYDAQAMGILGLDAGLAAAAVAGDGLLGHLWWLVLIGLLLSGVCCVELLFIRVDETGPRIEDLIAHAAAMSPAEMERLLVESVDESLRRNGRELDSKSDLILIAIAITLLTIFGAIVGVLAA